MKSTIHVLLFSALALACAEEPPPPAVAYEVEVTIAEVRDDDRNFIDASQEEFVVAMHARLEAYKTILEGMAEVAKERPEALAPTVVSDRLFRFDERVADLAEQLFAVKTAPPSGWTGQRGELLRAANELEDDLLATWDELRA